MFKSLLKWSSIGAVLLLAACHMPPVQGPNNPELSKQAKNSDIWVDLTPYPKQPSAPFDTNSDSVSAMSSSGWQTQIGYPDQNKARLGLGGGQWAVYYSDNTIRQVLIRWAEEAGWTFNNGLYELDVDIPISAEAVLLDQGPFKKAVQNLVEAVSLSEKPMRACFYENNVLRILNVNQSCNLRTQ